MEKIECNILTPEYQIFRIYLLIQRTDIKKGFFNKVTSVAYLCLNKNNKFCMVYVYDYIFDLRRIDHYAVKL